MAIRKTDAEKRREERRNYQKLERRLVLLAWLNGKFGFRENKELLGALKEAGEGFDEEGRSHVVGLLLARARNGSPPG